MDGNAVLQALAALSGPDCLKEILPKYGQRTKVYNVIKVADVASYEDVFLLHIHKERFSMHFLFLFLYRGLSLHHQHHNLPLSTRW